MDRNIPVDISKGIAIILVIIAHTLPLERNIMREMIYSFHMPLFFVLSAYTSTRVSKLQDVIRRGKRLLKKLLIPMLILWLVLAINSYIHEFNTYTTFADFVVHKLLQLFYASGVTNSQLAFLGGGNIERLGIAWFFAVLTISKIIYDTLNIYIRNSYRLIASLLCTTTGVYIGQLYHFPLSFDISLAVISLLWFGDFLKQHNITFGFRKFIIAFLSWFVLWILINCNCNWGLEIAGRSYPLFPLCFFMGIAGTMVIIYISDLIGRHKNIIVNELAKYGRLSLIILIIHCLDCIWEKAYIISESCWINIIVRVIIDISIFYLYLLGLKLFKDFKIKQQIIQY